MKKEIERLSLFLKALQQTKHCLSEGENTIGYSREHNKCYLRSAHCGALLAEMDSGNHVRVYDIRFLKDKRGRDIGYDWPMVDEFDYTDNHDKSQIESR